MSICECGTSGTDCCGRGIAHEERLLAVQQNQQGWIELSSSMKNASRVQAARQQRGHKMILSGRRTVYRPRWWIQEEEAKSLVLDYYCQRRRVEPAMTLLVAMAAMQTTRAGVMVAMSSYDPSFLRAKRVLQKELGVYELIGYQQPPHKRPAADNGRYELISLTDNSWAYFTCFGWAGSWEPGGYLGEHRQAAVFGAYQTRAAASDAVALDLLNPLTRDAARQLWHFDYRWDGSTPDYSKYLSAP